MNRIMIVHARRPVLDRLANALRREGHDVLTAACETEALDALAQALPDLLVLDLASPSAPGLPLLRRLYRDGTRNGVRLLLTAGDTAASAPLHPLVVEHACEEAFVAAVRRALRRAPGPHRRVALPGASPSLLLDLLAV